MGKLCLNMIAWGLTLLEVASMPTGLLMYNVSGYFPGCTNIFAPGLAITRASPMVETTSAPSVCWKKEWRHGLLCPRRSGRPT